MSDQGKERQRQQWYAKQTGQMLLAAERQAAQHLLRDSLGFRLLQLDAGAQYPLWLEQGSGCHCLLSLLPSRCHCPQIQARSDSLPFQSKSLDVIIMHHSLDFSADAYASLREASRCLTDSGTLLIFGFNPGIWSLLRQVPPLAPVLSDARFFSPHRVVDWLSLLDLQLESLDWLHPKCCHWFGRQAREPSFVSRKLGHFLPWLNASYVIKARKRTMARVSNSLLSPLPLGIARPQLNRDSLKVESCDK